MEHPAGEPEEVLLKNLGKEYYRLLFLVDDKHEHLSKEMRVSMQAVAVTYRQSKGKDRTDGSSDIRCPCALS